MAFAAVCSVPERNLLKMPVLSNCHHDVPALFHVFWFTRFVRLELHLNRKRQGFCPSMSCLQIVVPPKCVATPLLLSCRNITYSGRVLCVSSPCSASSKRSCFSNQWWDLTQLIFVLSSLRFP